MFVGTRGTDHRANHCGAADAAASAEHPTGSNGGTDATARANSSTSAHDRGRGDTRCARGDTRRGRSDTRRQCSHSHGRGGRQRGWQRNRFDDDHSGQGKR
jgi:hypothetical protein